MTNVQQLPCHGEWISLDSRQKRTRRNNVKSQLERTRADMTGRGVRLHTGMGGGGGGVAWGRGEGGGGGGGGGGVVGGGWLWGGAEKAPVRATAMPP